MNLTKCYKTRKDYQEFLKNKRVVIVGPAPSVLSSGQKDIIDTYDVVVRLNRALPIPEKLQIDVGTRTDVLYNCMNPSNECGGKIDAKLLKEIGVKFLVSPYSPVQNKFRFKKDIDEYFKMNGDIVPFCFINPDYFNKLLKIMQLPNTGICAILDLLQHDIKELYITGFTFFKGGYVKEYRPYNEQQVLQRMARYNLHNQEKQFKYMQNILLKDKRVKTDKALKDILLKKDVNFNVKDSGKSGSGKVVRIKNNTGKRKIIRKVVSKRKTIKL